METLKIGMIEFTAENSSGFWKSQFCAGDLFGQKQPLLLDFDASGFIQARKTGNEVEFLGVIDAKMLNAIDRARGD